MVPTWHHRSSQVRAGQMIEILVPAWLLGIGFGVDERRVLSMLRKYTVEQLGGGGVHHLVAADVVLDGDPRVGVAEEFGGEVDTG